jgi:hypothetical protein
MQQARSASAAAPVASALSHYAEHVRGIGELMHAGQLPASAVLLDAGVFDALRRAFDAVIEREHAPDDTRARVGIDRAYWQAEAVQGLDATAEWAKVRMLAMPVRRAPTPSALDLCSRGRAASESRASFAPSRSRVCAALRVCRADLPVDGGTARGRRTAADEDDLACARRAAARARVPRGGATLCSSIRGEADGRRARAARAGWRQNFGSGLEAPRRAPTLARIRGALATAP